MNRSAFPYKYNIVIDKEDGTCNLYYNCLNPYFTNGELVFYNYKEESKSFTENRVDMNNVLAFSLTKIE
ncbi:MAG: hypothetical protein J6T10_00340 [Methanobrevibacter sp.]|nr:hypothetical protein [Methanobrevibacter sp.]